MPSWQVEEAVLPACASGQEFEGSKKILTAHQTAQSRFETAETQNLAKDFCGTPVNQRALECPAS